MTLLRSRWRHQASPEIPVRDPMTCPGCKRSISPQPISYGYPSAEAGQSAERGEIYLGGCVVGRDFPSHRCRDCGIGLGAFVWASCGTPAGSLTSRRRRCPRST